MALRNLIIRCSADLLHRNAPLDDALGHLGFDIFRDGRTLRASAALRLVRPRIGALQSYFSNHILKFGNRSLSVGVMATGIGAFIAQANAFLKER